LYFVGLASAFSFGPAMRFVFGAKRAAAILTRTPSRRGAHALRTIAGQERSGTRTVGPIAGPTGGAPPVDLKVPTIGLLGFDNGPHLDSWIGRGAGC
jgi:hypothetical protein